MNIPIYAWILIGPGLALVVDHWRITLIRIRGEAAPAIACIPVETTTQTDVALQALLNATGEIEFRFDHPNEHSAPTKSFFIGGDVNIEVADKEVLLWVGRQTVCTTPTRSRDQVAAIIVGLLQVIDACQGLDEIRIINQIMVRAQAVQALMAQEGK